MWTSADTVLTTTSITTVSVSMRSAQSADRPPAWMKRSTGTVNTSPSPKATMKKAIHDSTAAITRKPEVTYSRRLGADRAAEQAGDQEAEKRQEDDGLVHASAQPFIMLTSSTAIEPRLR